ncbi:MAG: glycerophosphoryl diester phosphodiesterase membrane domain-containing protein [Halanaerobiales bacterium]
MGTMGLAEIMDRAFSILRKYIKTIILYSIGYGVIGIAAMIILIILAIIAISISVTIIGMSLGLMDTGFTGSAYTIGITIGLFTYLFAILSFSSGYQVGIVKISGQEFFRKRYYAKEAISATFKSILKVMGFIVLAFIFFIPVLVILGFIIYLMFPVLDQIFTLNIYGTGEIITIISAVILLLFAIFIILSYTVFLVFTVPALIVENKGIFAAMKRSYQLVKDRFWRIMGYLILFALSAYAINLSLQSFIGLLSGIIYLFLKLLFNTDMDYITFISIVYQFINWPIVIINYLIVTPIGSIMITLLYFNRRFEKEGYDILLSLMRLKEKKEKENMENVKGQSSDHSTQRI